jgi:hypothetical protein
MITPLLFVELQIRPAAGPEVQQSNAQLHQQGMGVTEEPRPASILSGDQVDTEHNTYLVFPCGDWRRRLEFKLPRAYGTYIVPF